MNGWNGFALNPMIGMAGMNMPPPAPNIVTGPPIGGGYMTPAGGSESFFSPHRANLGTLNTFAPTAVPGMPGPTAPGGWFGIEGLGKNLNTIRGGIGVLGGIAQIWNASQQNKLAKASFNHQRGILDTNLANQIKSYNLSIDDKFRSRGAYEGRDTSADIAKWQARDERKKG